MTDCTPYIDDLKAYADGELPWLRRQIVRRHLTHCASCQKEIIAMTQISDDLRSDDIRAAEPGETLPASLREKLLADVPLASSTIRMGKGIKEESVSSDSPMIKGGGASSRKRRAPAWVYACVALVAWFVFYPLYQKSREQAPIAMMAANPRPVRSAAPVRVAQAQSAMPASDKPMLMHPDIPQPVAALAPQALKEDFAPRAVHALPVPSPPASVAGRAAATNNRPQGAAPLDGSASANLLNGDPDSLRQVHKEASIGVQVPNPEATGDKINQIVQETGGYVAANNLTTEDDGMKSGELIVKVPEPQFETFLAQVTKLGVVVSKNITGQDITEKTSDAHEAQDVEESDLTQAEARLKALGTHAKWDDTQNAEDLRVQLAQTRARLKLLKRMAALGTITIDLNQTPKAAAAPPATSGFTGSLKATTHDALQSLAGSASALAALFIWLLAYAPIWVPLLLVGRYALKQYRKREESASKV